MLLHMRWLALVGSVLFFLSVPAKATPALVVDAESLQVLHSEDAGHRWYPASTTKLMTAFVVFESLRSGKLAMDSTVVISPNAADEKFLNSGLRIGRAMTLENALFALIVGSANDVAVALAETVAGSEKTFVQMMNDAAARLGMTASHFENPNGLFNSAQQASARDLAILGIAIKQLFPEHRRFFKTSRIRIDGRTIDSRNDLLARFPGAIGMKTGFLCAGGRNVVALAERKGKQVMVVILGATTERERNERAAQLLTQAFAGELQPNGISLMDLPNDASKQPEDMRARLCSAQAAAYEQSREVLYPMGLPGHGSFLGSPGQIEIREINTWLVDSPAPTPPQRPSDPTS